VHDRVDGVLGQRVADARIAHILLAIDHARQLTLRRHLAHIERHQDLERLSHQRGQHAAPEEPIAARHEHAAAAWPAPHGVAGLRPHQLASARPATMSQNPHTPATTAMPPSPPKKLKISTSPSPALRMPTSMDTARRS
jgi:hypothetical protein